jgi:hypothetical protein
VEVIVEIDDCPVRAAHWGKSKAHLFSGNRCVWCEGKTPKAERLEAASRLVKFEPKANARYYSRKREWEY